jgi:hypothetical protein
VKIFSTREKLEPHERGIAQARLNVVARRCRDEASAYPSLKVASACSSADRPRRVFWTPDELSSEQSGD